MTGSKRPSISSSYRSIINFKNLLQAISNIHKNREQGDEPRLTHHQLQLSIAASLLSLTPLPTVPYFILKQISYIVSSANISIGI